MREAVRYDQDYAGPDAGLRVKTAVDENDTARREDAGGSTPGVVTPGVVKLVYAADDLPFDEREWHPLAGPAPTD